MNDAAEGLVRLDRYPILGTADRRPLVEGARRRIAETGCALFPGFVTEAALAGMVTEANAAYERSFRREVSLPAYEKAPLEDVPISHPLRRKNPYKMFVAAADLLLREGPILRLYQSDELTRLVADVLREPILYRVADPMLNCVLTYMNEGDQHGWHFDANDFVVSLLLQSAESGGEFEFAPWVRSDTDENYGEVDRVMDGTSALTRRLRVEAGTLIVFCGKRALHRVAPVVGGRRRIIALLSYDRTLEMHYSEALKMNATGRAEVLPPTRRS